MFCVVAFITNKKQYISIKITADLFSADQLKLQLNDPKASWKTNWDLSFRKRKKNLKKKQKTDT